MARPGPQTQAKRQRELAKMEKRRKKEAKRALRKAEKASGAENDAGGTDASAQEQPAGERVTDSGADRQGST